MIAEAVDAAIAVGWALLVWIVLTAVAATAALYAVIAAGWWVCRGAWRTVRALIPRRAPSACATRALGRTVALASGETLPAPPEAHHVNPPRTTPTWARTDTEEAA